MSTADKILDYLLKNNISCFSGEDMSKYLGVSRTAVWKAIEKLRSEGFIIGGSTKSGYSLSVPPQLIDKRIILGSLKNSVSDLIVLDSVNSTNTYAGRLIFEGASDRCVVIAKEQTAGKGRLGRSFSSPSGEGLYYSYILKPEPRRLSLLTSLAGLAVCDIIKEQSGLLCKIKWPNDIIYNGKKVCGILTSLITDAETATVTHAVVGIGINVLQKDFPPELKDKAASIFTESGKEISINALAAALTDRLTDIFYNKSIDDSEAVSRLNALSCTVGNVVDVISPTVTRRGRALSIDDSGALIVDFDGNTEAVFSGEVSVRGILGYT